MDEGYPKISKESASLCRIVNDGINRVSEDEHYKVIRLDVIQSKYGSMLYTDITMLRNSVLYRIGFIVRK